MVFPAFITEVTMTEKSVRCDRITVSFIPDKASAETAVETIRNFMLRVRRN